MVREGQLKNQMAVTVGAGIFLIFKQSRDVNQVILVFPNLYSPPAQPPQETQLQKSFYGPFLLFHAMKAKIGKFCVNDLNMLQRNFNEIALNEIENYLGIFSYFV